MAQFRELTPAQGFEALDWLVRTCAPAWLDAAELNTEAASLRSLPPLLDVNVVRASADSVRVLQDVAYRRAGVLRWSQVDACYRPFGAMGAKNAALAATGFDHSNPDHRLVSRVAGYAWTVAAFAAHAVSDDDCRDAAEKLAATLPHGVEG